MQILWSPIRDPACYRAEEAYHGQGQAVVKLKYPPVGGGTWEVTVVVEIPGQEPWSHHWPYERLHRAIERYGRAKDEAARRLAGKIRIPKRRTRKRKPEDPPG